MLVIGIVVNACDWHSQELQPSILDTPSKSGVCQKQVFEDPVARGVRCGGLEQTKLSAEEELNDWRLADSPIPVRINHQRVVSWPWVF